MKYYTMMIMINIFGGWGSFSDGAMRDGDGSARIRGSCKLLARWLSIMCGQDEIHIYRYAIGLFANTHIN